MTGGAARGFYQAGFDEIVGVDIAPQKNYPFEFVQADAMTWTDWDFDWVTASPPCQGFSRTRHLPWNRDKIYPNLLTPIRNVLKASGVPYVIENVPGAPMRADAILCGTMFGLPIIRHRWFEISVPVPVLTPPCNHWGSVRGGDFWCVVGDGFGAGFGGRKNDGAIARYAGKATASIAMGGLDWMYRYEMVQAVPPPYTKFLGRAILRYLKEDKNGSKTDELEDDACGGHL